MKILYIIILNLCAFNLFAQASDPHNEKPNISVSGFADVFYVYDFNQPQGTSRQGFLYNHNRHNEFNLNLALIKLGVEHSKYRANVAFQVGTYANDNYAAETDVMKNVFEANIGVSLNKNNTLWLDAGVFPSHIGFESAISTDNLTLTRSLLAENSPYFLTGAKLTYSLNDTWTVAALIVNGWQRIQRLKGNSLPSLGTQVSFQPTDKVSLNWSTFLGTDDPDITRRMRYFNNVYGQFYIMDKLQLILGFDFGVQQKTKGSNSYDVWLSPIAIGQLTIKNNLKTSIRAEYYQDKTGIIIPKTTTHGFQTLGFSWNIDFTPYQNIVYRFETRWLASQDKLFEAKTNPTDNNLFFATSIAIKFNQKLTK